MPRLLIVGDDGSERLVALTERTMQIGRGPGNDIVLADASQGVSRTHAELRFRNGRCVIVDLQSQNGTWLNGQRVQHAEVPDDAEITIGSYRLRVLSDDKSRDVATAAMSRIASPDTDHKFVEPAADTSLRDVVLVRPQDSRGPATDPSKSPSDTLQTWLLAGFVVAVAALAWMTFAPRTETGAIGATGSTGATGAVGDPAATGAAAPPVTDPLLASPTVPTPDMAPLPAGDAERPARAERPAEGRRPAVTVRPNGPPVAQRPGESAEAYRARTAAFQTRYVYSRAALDRGDFAAAAGGFEAILREEPGFMDVPQLLLRARAGLRAAAVDLYDTGQRLENAGEWLGALQRYEQARQVHPDVPGLGQATRRVREKLRAAGTTAFTRARQLEARGLPAEALKEYEKAVQWLPLDDTNREIAHGRVDQLKRTLQ